jgi:hypothetical protein
MAKVQKGSVQTGKGDPWGEGACLRSVRCGVLKEMPRF